MRVEVSYSDKYFRILDNFIVDRLGHPESSGCGFGYRDLVYVGRTASQIRKLLGGLVRDYDINISVLV